jgi:hypothetical protein
MGNCLSDGGSMDKQVKRATARFAKSPVDSKSLDLTPAEVRTPKPAAPGKGAYLFYDTGSNGQMLLIWSEEPVEVRSALYRHKQRVQSACVNVTER